MTVTNEDAPSLTRTQKRFLRRIYNGRSIPIIADGKPFLTYKDASQYLLSLEPQARDAAYGTMKAQANSRIGTAEEVSRRSEVGASSQRLTNGRFQDGE